jgi:hypothetical protein
MFPEERSKHLNDGFTVGRGIMSYALEGINATDADIELVTSKLVNGSRESLSYLTLTISLERSPCSDSAGDQYSAANCLKQRQANSIHSFGTIGRR